MQQCITFAGKPLEQWEKEREAAMKEAAEFTSSKVAFVLSELEESVQKKNSKITLQRKESLLCWSP